MTARWVNVASTTVAYPSDHRGTATTTAADSLLARAVSTTLYGLLITGQDASTDATLTVYGSDGTTVYMTFRVPAVSSTLLAGRECYVPLGGPQGWTIPDGLAFKTSLAGATAIFFYDVEYPQAR